MLFMVPIFCLSVCKFKYGCRKIYGWVDEEVFLERLMIMRRQKFSDDPFKSNVQMSEVQRFGGFEIIFFLKKGRRAH